MYESTVVIIWTYSVQDLSHCMQDEFSLDSTWKPKIKLSDLTDEDCPCPHEYMDVS